MKTFSLPNLATSLFVFSNKGPFLPSTTLLNSLKSHSAPLEDSMSPFLANSSAVSLPVSPFGIVYNTLLFVLANVSSKSSTLIPFLLVSAVLSIAFFIDIRAFSAFTFSSIRFLPAAFEYVCLSSNFSNSSTVVGSAYFTFAVPTLCLGSAILGITFTLCLSKYFSKLVLLRFSLATYFLNFSCIKKTESACSKIPAPSNLYTVPKVAIFLIGVSCPRPMV